MEKELSGFINIDKPVDWTSHDVVAKLRRLLGTKRIGHAGTLDPFATGVLPIAIGTATRLIRFLAKSKRYSAVIDLRNTTDTDDLTGELLRQSRQELGEAELLAKLKAMEGDFDQIPPLYSAKKINGKKLYELMREGHDLDLSELKAKRIHIKELNLVSFDYPFATIELSCGEGTYVRSIARDVGGHLVVLRRLESNGFDIKSAIRFEDLLDGDLELEDLILEATDYLDLPGLSFNSREVTALQQGQKVNLEAEAISNFRDGLLNLEQEEQYLKCLDSSKELIGIANIFKENGKDFAVKPKVIL